MKILTVFGSISGFHKDDTAADIDYMVDKILNTRIFAADGEGREKTVVEKGLDVLCVSQPTFFAVVRGKIIYI